MNLNMNYYDLGALSNVQSVLKRSTTFTTSVHLCDMVHISRDHLEWSLHILERSENIDNKKFD